MLKPKISQRALTTSPQGANCRHFSSRLICRGSKQQKADAAAAQSTAELQSKQFSPMNRLATIVQEAVTPSNSATSMPGNLGSIAAAVGVGMLLSRVMSREDKVVLLLQSQQAAVAAQLQQQQAAMQTTLIAQQTQLQTQQAQQLARALQGTGMSSRNAVLIANQVQTATLQERMKAIQEYFPKALPVDDFMNRVEVALAGLGFTGDNAIAMSNLCRDESCMILEDKIESVFGSCFSTHGLGGVLTCGSIGIQAGLSHSPVFGGKEQYVFFSFPHIAIDSLNQVGKISRPNRPGPSSACGALCACLADFQKDGLEVHCRVPGVHDAENPEYSILKQRLARQLRSENCNPADLDLVSITKAAERTITNDLEYLISQAVDPKTANYAVFTGVQVHNWASDLTDRNIPSLEFVSVGESYSVVDGKKTNLDVMNVPPLAPRQLRLLGQVSEEQHPDNEQPANNTTIQEVPRGYLLRRVGGSAGTRYISTPDIVKT